MIVETEHHITQTETNKLPDYKCSGSCKKVWWKSDLPEVHPFEFLYCPKCDGKLKAAKSEDYKVLKSHSSAVSESSGIQINHLSNLKSEFVQKAKDNNWK